MPFACIYVCMCVHTHTCAQTQMHVSHFFIHSFVDGHLGYFHILTTVNCATVNIGGRSGLTLRSQFQYFLDKYSEMGLIHHQVVLFFIF